MHLHIYQRQVYSNSQLLMAALGYKSIMTIEHENVVGFNVFRGKHIALNTSSPTYDDQLVDVMCQRYVPMQGIVPFWNHTLLYLRCTVYSWARTVMFSDVCFTISSHLRARLEMVKHVLKAQSSLGQPETRYCCIMGVWEVCPPR